MLLHMSGPRPKVLLAMSGGVDSSVSAALLLEQGYDVVGVFMRLGSSGEALDELLPATDEAAKVSGKIKIGHQGCCSINDAADGRLVAAQLGIPFYVVNFKKDFGRIMDYFVAEYAIGRTPNPCVRCNDWLKFGKLHDYATQIDAQFVASGHYARVGISAGSNGRQPSLMRGLDVDKDQSYVLFGVPREKLGKMMLPVGGMNKPDVRAVAERYKLPVFNKPDSQEICFVPDNDYAGFIERKRPDLAAAARGEGRILDPQGQTVGTHGGQHRFTIGQRRGVGMALGYPIYVVGKDPEANTITVGPKDMLETMACIGGEANWLADLPLPGESIRCMAQYRYNSDPVAATVSVLPDAPESQQTPSGRRGRFAVTFDAPQSAVTPGQAVVLYQGEVVLGGGWIESVQATR